MYTSYRTTELANTDCAKIMQNQYTVFTYLSDWLFVLAY